MIIRKTSISDLLIIQPNINNDDRGYFFESYKNSDFELNNLPTRFVQHNQSKSTRGVLRGLHYQLQYGQDKLVWVSQGEVMDVAVDIRKDSPTFGHYESLILNDENHKRFYIPKGFAHGYYVLTEIVILEYMCTETFHPEDEFGIRWDDPDINIDWPMGKKLLSDRDKKLPSLKQIETKKLPLYK